MLGRKLVAAASFVVFVSGAASAQTAASDAARTEDLVKQAVERYAAGLEAARAQSAQEPTDARRRCPLTLEDAVRRAIDNNLEMAVERLNPQTFDFTLASLRANYKPNATSTFGRRDNVRPPTNLLNPGSPNVSTMTYNAGIAQNLRWGGGNYALDVQQHEGRLADRPAGVASIPSSTARTSSATRSRCCAGSGSIRRGSRCRRPSSTATTPS